MKRILIIMIFLSLSAVGRAVGLPVKEFKVICDSLPQLIHAKCGVRASLQLKSVEKVDTLLNFRFNETLGDYPWRPGDDKWLRREIKGLLPHAYSDCSVGRIYCNSYLIDNYFIPSVGNDGKPVETSNRVTDNRGKSVTLVTRMEEPWYNKGLSGRHIALWQSHGTYFEGGEGRWTWQRAPLFTTVEDVFTQMYVIPYLVPMLEKAGANVLLPRERDLNPLEVIIDNDGGSTSRSTGVYREKGGWEVAGAGFADNSEIISDDTNPFACGTAMKITQIKNSSPDVVDSTWAGASVTWTPAIPERRGYAVYVSYRTVQGSTNCAHYTVHHLGGDSHFSVNQTICGSTWVYLGTFEFEAGCAGYVTLDNGTPSGHKGTAGKIVTADAVKFGGGIGNIARYQEEAGVEEACVSGRPRFLEGSRYWLQWAGFDKSVWKFKTDSDDYTDDFTSRGSWVNTLVGESVFNKSAKGKGVPVDLALAWHSDAGVSKFKETTIGTLAIYSLPKDGKTVFPNQSSRWTNREYADFVQTQLVEDVKALHNPQWVRREIRDRSYSESRTPDVPAMILEFLSHQNLEDMKFGLDPEFRFTVARAVYKGMLKYLSSRYGCQYAVQPLPVHAFSVTFSPDGNRAQLKWEATKDPLEPTAATTGFRVYTRVDDGDFGNPQTVAGKNDGNVDIPIESGHIYSFIVTATNAGGESFPSEILSIGKPEDKIDKKHIVGIVNNFTRVSAPLFSETDSFGFIDDNIDCGVPYRYEAGYIGRMYECYKGRKWVDDDNPGFGASYSECAGKVIAGNSFDYPSVHGRAVLAAGYPFCSMSVESFTKDYSVRQDLWTVDLVCGKQLTTELRNKNRKERFRVFSRDLQDIIRICTYDGVDFLVSGAYIGSDIWNDVRVTCDADLREESEEFARDVLGFRLLAGKAARNGDVWVTGGKSGLKYGGERHFKFNKEMDGHIYKVESTDALLPSNDSGHTILRYTENNVSAGVCFEGNGYRTVCIGFPLETITDSATLDGLMSSILEYFDAQ